jgi:type IV secretory pathway VirB10-like protein
MEGDDQAGYAGEHDQVDTHLPQKFLMTSLIAIGGAAAQLSQPQQSAFQGYSPSSVGTGALAQGFNQLGQSYAQQGLSIPDTLVIRPGYQMVVSPDKDLPLTPYIDRRFPLDEQPYHCSPDTD